jgi:hypothetical protein
VEKSFLNKWTPETAGVAILISNKVDFRLKSIRRDNEGHLILMKGKIHQEEISIFNIYAPNMGTHLHQKILVTLGLQIDYNAAIVGDLILSPIDR